MSLTNLHFLSFLATVIAACFILPHRLRNPILLAASLNFYWSWNFWTMAVLAFSVVSSYVLAIFIEEAKADSPWRGKVLFVISIILQVTLLCLFKYLTPLELGNFSLVMPSGLSFYSFQIIAALSDVYTGKARAERNLIDGTLFVSFFSKIIEEPIERTDFLVQLKQPPTFRWEVFRLGAVQFLWGIFKLL